MTARIRLRRADADNWTALNPILDYGEVALVFDDFTGTKKCVGFKVGNGSTAFNDLPMHRAPVMDGSTDGDTGLGSSGTSVEGEGNLPTNWSEIPVLARDNTFTGINTFDGTTNLDGPVVAGTDVDPDTTTALAIKGKVTIDEYVDDANDCGLTVNGGDVVLEGNDDTDGSEGGNVVLPLCTAPSGSGTVTEHAVKGTGTAEGALTFTADGPVLANGGDLTGKWLDGSDDRSGPNIIVKQSEVVIGGEEVSAAGTQPELVYAAAPAADWDSLGSLAVPSKSLVASHVTDSAVTSGQVYFTSDGRPVVSPDTADGWKAHSSSGTWLEKILVKDPEWVDRYLTVHLAFTAGDSDAVARVRLQSYSGDDLNSWYDSPVGGSHVSGSNFLVFIVPVVAEAPLDSDGKLKLSIARGAHADAADDLWLTSMTWWASSSAPSVDNVTSIETT